MVEFAHVSVASHSDNDTLAIISALTHGELAELIRRDVVQPELFDENDLVEISDPEKEGERYCLCRNPVTAESESATRRRLMALTEDGLARIAAYRQAVRVETPGARIGKLLAEIQSREILSLGGPPPRTVRRKNRVTLQGLEFDQITETDEEQQEILRLLKAPQAMK